MLLAHWSWRSRWIRLKTDLSVSIKSRLYWRGLGSHQPESIRVYIKLLKIDAEGSDDKMLEAAIQVLNGHKPMII